MQQTKYPLIDNFWCGTKVSISTDKPPLRQAPPNVVSWVFIIYTCGTEEVVKARNNDLFKSEWPFLIQGTNEVIEHLKKIWAEQWAQSIDDHQFVNTATIAELSKRAMKDSALAEWLLGPKTAAEEAEDQKRMQDAMKKRGLDPNKMKNNPIKGFHKKDKT